MDAFKEFILNFFKGTHFSLEPTTQNILVWIAVVIILGMLLKFFGSKKTFSFALIIAVLLLVMVKIEQYMTGYVKTQGEPFDPWLIRMVFAAIGLLIFCYYCFIKD